MTFKEQTKLVGERVGETARECGLLWLVFSLLDRLVEQKLTVPGVLWNLSGSVALWIFGMYVELRMKSDDS